MTATAEQQPQPLEATDLRLWAFLDLDLPEDRSPVRLAWRDLAARAGELIAKVRRGWAHRACVEREVGE